MRIHRSPALAGLLVLALGACAQSAAESAGTGPVDAPLADGSAPGPSIQDAVPSTPGALSRIGALLARWDRHQGEGQAMEAQALEPQLRGEVDTAWPSVVAAARGSRSSNDRYIAVSALAFASNPEATTILSERLADRDANLVGNALVALSIRKDPSTPLAPVVRWIDRRAPALPQRYAPLVFASVVDAQKSQLGKSMSPGEQAEMSGRLRDVSTVSDGFTRLHVAKALGVVGTPQANATLRDMLRNDKQMRVRWAAAAALERTGDPDGFPEVVRLLHDSAPASKRVIQDLLVSYGGRLRGHPLSAAEISTLGTNAAQWSRWHAERLRNSGGAAMPPRAVPTGVRPPGR